MRNVIFYCLVIVGMMVFSSCRNNQDEVDPNEKDFVKATNSGDLAGKWLLNETGYSPGAGYVVTPVPATPPQTITFFSNGQFLSNMPGLEDYKFFEVTQDEQTQSEVLVLYKSEQERTEKPASAHSYTMTFPEGELRLSFRYCIEGCHWKFAKLANTGGQE